MLEMFARDADETRDIPMMGELILGLGETADRHQREFAQFRIERGTVSQFSTEGEKSPQQIRRMREGAKYIADRLTALLDETIENLTVGFRQVVTIEIRNSRHLFMFSPV